MACCMELRPLSWTKNKEGVERFSSAVFQAGTHMLPGQVINVKDMLPCTKTVRAKLLELEGDKREEDKQTKQLAALSVGAGMSCDGLKQKHTGTKVMSASFCQSERVFSAGNKILTKDRCRLNHHVLCSLIFLRSLLLSEK